MNKKGGAWGNEENPGGSGAIFRIAPYQYIHVIDQTTNVTRLEVGPQTYIRKDNERVILGPEKMVIVAPRHYCMIENPVQRDSEGKPVYDDVGQVKLQHAELEVRLEQEPFPLYPGEKLQTSVTPLHVVARNTALRLVAKRDFVQGTGEDAVHRNAGEVWLFEGPGTYIPRKEVEVGETVCAQIIRPNQALKLRAMMDTNDREGAPRVTGEEWLVRKVGAYLPGAYEEVVEVVNAIVLTDKEAVHVQAKRTFKDENGKTRRNGEEWLVLQKDTETFIPGVYEEVVKNVPITTLTNRQYCVILNPLGPDGTPQLGQKKLIKGEKSFFLQPGECLESGIQDVFVLGENEGLILKAREALKDNFCDPAVDRSPGDKWLIRGPVEYFPPVEVEVVTRRTAIPLDKNEGIYVRDIKSGEVRAVIGMTYLLNQDEELWEKELPEAVENLIGLGKDVVADRGLMRAALAAPQGPKGRDRTRVVTFRVPHNTAVQIYDYKDKKARVIFGPDLVLLGPDEQFTQLSLSGGKPKKPNQIRALGLMLGPDFCTDIVVVETADHARLSLQVAYNWHFDIRNHSDETATKIFSVPDFVGDCCKAIASRIRGAVAGVKFDDFHKNSSKIIRVAVFGADEMGKVREKIMFDQNNLVVTSIDIQSVEPVDQRTRDSLQKSVQLAIEITTNSQEAAARHEAERLEQEARGRLEQQKILDEAEAEKTRRHLLELQAESAAVESCGQSTAEARSRADAAAIEAKAAVEQAKLKAEASAIEAESELERLMKARRIELDYVKEQNTLEVQKAKELALIDVEKFKEMMSALGQETLTALAKAGPQHQVEMLKALGLHSTLITDGRNPINLLNTADGLLGGVYSRSIPPIP